MTKEIIEKVTQQGNSLDVNDLNAEEKKNLAEFLSTKGFTDSTFYLRFFQKGFDTWEILGINKCKSYFLGMPDIGKVLLEYVERDALGKEIGDKGYLYTLAKSDKPGVFYACLKQAANGLCMKLYSFMEERGMSRTTIIKRFSSDDWKEWEKVGIKALLEEFIKSKKSVKE